MTTNDPTSPPPAGGDAALLGLAGFAPDLAALTDRLSATALGLGDLDVVHREVPTPLGTLLLAASDAGIVRVAFERQGFAGVLETLAEEVGARVLPARTVGQFGLVDDAARELDEYFSGARRTFDVALDRRTEGFRGAVLAHLPRIAFGRTESYAEAAAAVGNPRAVRAVGTACARNPLPILVPCHRVVRSDGSLGQYAGGPEAKAYLLRLEGAA